MYWFLLQFKLAILSENNANYDKIVYCWPLILLEIAKYEIYLKTFWIKRQKKETLCLFIKLLHGKDLNREENVKDSFTIQVYVN
jgi:hypothetical protein